MVGGREKAKRSGAEERREEERREEERRRVRSRYCKEEAERIDGNDGGGRVVLVIVVVWLLCGCGLTVRGWCTRSVIGM